MKHLARLRAEVAAASTEPVKLLVNQEQRVNAIGGGKAVASVFASPVARHNIESAAREGYLDALALKGFSRHYDDAPGPWQRNYEIGRLWAAGMRVCGIDPPDWPEHEARQLAAITRATEEIARQIGALRPEIEGIKAPSDNLPVLHEPLQFRRGRIIERKVG